MNSEMDRIQGVIERAEERGRIAEREACARDVCLWCHKGDPAIRNERKFGRLIYFNQPDGAHWKHSEGYLCEAAKIRERAWREANNVV